MYKLKQDGISGNLLDTITDFLNSRKQRVAFTGQFSSWTSTEAGYLKDQYLDHDYFKVGLSLYKKICVICFIESSVKMMKNAFYFILKALFVLKIFNFLS